MLEKIFSFFTLIGYIWWIHILWLLCSVPLITIGASTTALNYACMKLRKQEGYVTANFFHSFKENFRQSTCLFLIYLIIGVILGADIVFCSQMHTAMGQILKMAACIILFPYLISGLYVFAVQARFVNPIKQTIKYSFMLGLRHLKATVMLVIIVAAIIALNMTIVLVNFITISMGIGFAAYIMAGIFNRVFDQYIKNDTE